MSHQGLVITLKSDKDLSKLQKQFNANVKKINELKQQLEDDEASLRLIVTRIQSEIIPIEQKHFNKIAELVYVFDKHYDDPFFKKKEKAKMADFIINQSHELIENKGNQELKTIYDKYADEPFDKMDAKAENATAEMMKDMMSSMFGVEFDEDADVSDPKKMQEYMEKKMQEKEANAQAKKTNKKKTDKQIEKEEKIKAEAKSISKAARSIYTDLVKAFHPDRERDETERDRKTEIMKRVTQAYEKDDLFELLRLKIELQGSDIDSLTMADEQLKYYNKILKEQVRELEENLWQLRMQSTGPTGGEDLLSRFGGDEKTMEAKIARQVNKLKNNIKMIEQDILALRIKENMRRFLKNYEIQEELDDDFVNFLQSGFFR